MQTVVSSMFIFLTAEAYSLKFSHVFSRFDKRITEFAEEKFRRDGIDVKTGSMVTKVDDKQITTKEMKTGKIETMPYGMALWSTGIGSRPFIRDFMNQIGQVW